MKLADGLCPSRENVHEQLKNVKYVNFFYFSDYFVSIVSEKLTFCLLITDNLSRTDAMRHIDTMRKMGGLIFLLMLCHFVPSFYMTGHAATENDPNFFYRNPVKSWGWDGGHDFETVIRGQNRYTSYLRNYGIWADLYSYEGRLRPKDYLKMKNSDTGMQFGVDLPSGRMFTSSFYYSYASPKFTFLSLQDSELKTTSHNFGIRWTSDSDGLYMQFGVNGGFDQYDVNEFGNRLYDGNGWQMGGNGELGLDVDLEPWKLRPLLGFDYRWLHHDKLSGQNAWLDSGTSNAFYSNLGVRIFRHLGPILEWQTRLSWLHNFLNSDDPIRVQRFGATPGATSPTQFYLDGNLGRDWLWFGTGLKLHFGSFFNFFVDYDLTFNKYEATHCGSIMLLLSW